MNKEFLKNFKVGESVLPDAIVDAIMTENQRDIAAAKANPGANGESGKLFTQDEVNRIVSDRLNREREKQTQQPEADEREQALKAREARLDCRDYLDSKSLPAALLDVLDCSDVEKFKAAASLLVEKFPSVKLRPTPPPYARGTGSESRYGNDLFADAFKPPVN